MSSNLKMEKPNVVYPYSGILLSLKKEGNSDRCYKMDEPWKYYAKWKKPVIKSHILYDSIHIKSRKQKSEETKRTVVD